jgi:DNA repair exonuclease SbcCD ATPase subunit
MDLAVRLGRLEERADSVEAFMAGPQTNALQENEQIAAQLRKLEQKLNTLTDQVSLIEQTIDGANRRDQERNKSIEVRLTSTENEIGELYSRLELGEKARADLGGVISLFVKQLKRVNITSAEIAVRVAELETRRTKIARLEERLGSTPGGECERPAENVIASDGAEIGRDPPSQGDEASETETKHGSTESKPTLTEEPPNEPFFAVSKVPENGLAFGAKGPA